MQGQAWTVRLEYHQISSWRLSSKIHSTSDGVKFILLMHCSFWRPVAWFQRDTPVRHRVDLRSQITEYAMFLWHGHVKLPREMFSICPRRVWWALLIFGLSQEEGEEKPEEERTGRKSSQSHKEQQCRGAGSEGTFRSFDITWSMCGTCVPVELFFSSRPSHWHQTVFIAQFEVAKKNSAVTFVKWILRVFSPHKWNYWEMINLLTNLNGKIPPNPIQQHHFWRIHFIDMSHGIHVLRTMILENAVMVCHPSLSSVREQLASRAPCDLFLINFNITGLHTLIHSFRHRSNAYSGQKNTTSTIKIVMDIIYR